jgi:DNA polymerase elongation subunit (family B)
MRIYNLLCAFKYDYYGRSFPVLIRKEASLELENCYKFLVLLPLEAEQKIEALRRYFGITQSNELIARGMEVRRHDAPTFIKRFQTELLYTLFDCKDFAEATT